MNFENSIIKYNVTNCKIKKENHVDKQDWRDKIEFVGEETAEQADWPSRSLRGLSEEKSNHKTVCKIKTEIEIRK